MEVRNHIVLFLDILGYSSLITSCKDSHAENRYLDKVHSIGSYPRFLTEQPGKQGYKGHADQGNAAAGHKLFYPQLGVKTLLDGGRRRTKTLYGVVKRTVPAGQVRQ